MLSIFLLYFTSVSVLVFSSVFSITTACFCFNKGQPLYMSCLNNNYFCFHNSFLLLSSYLCLSLSFSLINSLIFCHGLFFIQTFSLIMWYMFKKYILCGYLICLTKNHMEQWQWTMTMLPWWLYCRKYDLYGNNIFVAYST